MFRPFLVIALLAALPTLCSAQLRGPDETGVAVRRLIPVPAPRPPVPPPPGHGWVWVPPVYRTVEDRRWIEPVYQTVTDHVWVPDQFEDRQVRYMDRGVWCTRVDHVLVVPAHYEDRSRQVCLTEGHWETYQRQECVAEGHYEVHRERVRVADPVFGGIGLHIGR